VCICNGLAGFLGAAVGCLLADVMPIVGGCVGGATAAFVSVLCNKLWHCGGYSPPCPPAAAAMAGLTATLLGCVGCWAGVSEETKHQIITLLSSFDIAAIFGITGC
jgi:hypothetical protein